MRRLMEKAESGQPDRAPLAAVSEPMTVRINMATKLTGISRSQIYELIQAGRLDTVKVGRVNLIRYSSLKKLLGL